MAAVVCENCGTSNPAGRQFCENCDGFLDWTGTEPDPVAAAPPAAAPPAAGEADPPDPADDTAGTTAKASAADRRRALALLIDLWRGLARDLEVISRGAIGSVRDVALLEDLERAAASLPPGAAAEAVVRFVRAGELLEVNATPELVLDVLLVRWPRTGRAA